MERNAKGAGEVVIAGAGSTQSVRRVRRERVHRPAGKDAQRLEGGGDVRVRETEVSMSSLREDLHQACRFETAQMHTCRRRTDVGGEGELGGSSRAVVEQTTKHARARRLPNCCRHVCNPVVR